MTRELRAKRNIKYAAWNLIGGLENVLADYEEEDLDYIDAENCLENHDMLVNTVYEMATTGLYDEGLHMFGGNIDMFVRDIRFCGKEQLMKWCEYYVCKEGY